MVGSADQEIPGEGKRIPFNTNINQVHSYDSFAYGKYQLKIWRQFKFSYQYAKFLQQQKQKVFSLGCFQLSATICQ